HPLWDPGHREPLFHRPVLLPLRVCLPCLIVLAAGPRTNPGRSQTATDKVRELAASIQYRSKDIACQRRCLHPLAETPPPFLEIRSSLGQSLRSHMQRPRHSPTAAAVHQQPPSPRRHILQLKSLAEDDRKPRMPYL